MRHIPGTEQVEGRGFIYLECRDPKEFRSVFPKIATYGESPLPGSGGAINEDFALLLPDGTRLCCISFKGDLAGWKRKVIEYAETLGLKFGEIFGDVIRLQGGDTFAVNDCQFEDYLKYK